MNKLIIIGYGDQGGIIESIVRKLKMFKIVGFIDDNKKGSMCKIDQTSKIIKNISNVKLFIAIANNTIRKKVFLSLGEEQKLLTTIIHPTAYIENNVKLGRNVFIGANSFVNYKSVIGDGTYINSGCIIEHDNQIGNFCHLAPGVITGGRLKIKDNCFIGLGSRINDQIIISKNTFIGTGSVVVRSFIKENLFIAGIPAKEKKVNKKSRNHYQ